MVMGVIGWILFGLIAGYIASTSVNRHGEGLPMNIGIGMVGAVIGGWLFNTFGSVGVTGFNAWSLPVAGIGAVLLLVVWQAVRRSPRHA